MMSTNLHQFVHLVNCSASSKPVQDYGQAYTYIAALTRQPPETAIIDVRLIHDTDKSVPAIKRRGTLPQLWAEIIDWQNRGYGCFVNVSEMDGIGNDLSNVAAVRAHLADLDGIDAQAQLQNAAAWTPAPTFGVSTSPGKAHVYWVVQPYQSNEYFTALQRRIRQAFNGDPSVIDASRVARMPGTLHLKNPQQPYLVNCFSLGGYGQSLNVETLAASLQHVNVIEGHHGRKELGDTTLQAPSLEWLSFAMSYVDPNTLDRGDWLSITAAFKQAGWNHADEQTLFNMWSQWCAQYNGNDPAENLKNWNSIRNSEIGWKSFRRRVPVLKAYEDFGYKEPPKPQPQPVPGSQSSPEYLDGISADHVKSTTAGAMKKMQELGIPLAFDEFTKTAFLEMPVPWDKTGVFPRPWTDNDITGLKTLLESHYLKPSKETVNDAATFIAKRNSYHPIRDYLNSLIWDGCPRLETLLPHYFGAEDNEYTRAVGKRFMIGAIARVMDPGCKLDTMLIIEGSQGLKKSTAFKILAGANWFSDQLPDISSKDAAIQLLGIWILEVAELSAFNRAETNRIKSFASSATDRFRTPYEKSAQNHPRQSVLVGTTNDEAYLKDQTGNRRYWPVKVTAVDVDGLRRDRDQLWAEARVRYAINGEQWWLTDEEQRSAVGEQEARREVDPWEERITAYVLALNGEPVSATTIATILGLSNSEFNGLAAKRIATCLNTVGYRRKQFREADGSRVWKYALS